MKILITDDSAFMRTVVKNALKDINADFYEAENGDVAVDLFKEYKPEIVLLDIIMPVKNGVMALQEIKELEPKTIVILVTSVGQDEMVEKAKELGANDFVPKPFQPAQLQEVVQKYIK